MSKTKDREQAVKSLGRSYHEVLEAHIPFLRTEHHLNFPAVRIVDLFGNPGKEQMEKV